MEMSCSRPDWEVPCKHLAAVCYVLAEAFDDDPFAMLACRGRGREKLLASRRRDQCRTARAAGPGDQRDRSAVGRVPGRLLVARVEPGPAAGDAHGSGDLPDLLLRSFEPPSIAVRGQDLADAFASIYQRLAGHGG